jgi:hypothetical protein
MKIEDATRESCRRIREGKHTEPLLAPSIIGNIEPSELIRSLCNNVIFDIRAEHVEDTAADGPQFHQADHRQVRRGVEVAL